MHTYTLPSLISGTQYIYFNLRYHQRYYDRYAWKYIRGLSELIILLKIRIFWSMHHIPERNEAENCYDPRYNKTGSVECVQSDLVNLIEYNWRQHSGNS